LPYSSKPLKHQKRLAAGIRRQAFS